MISKEYIISVAMDNAHLERMMHEENANLYDLANLHEDNMNLFFGLHIIFRDNLLKNPKRHGLTSHEILVGGSILTNGNKTIISGYMPLNEIFSSAYCDGEGMWALILAATYHGLLDPDPQATCGNTDSIVRNITEVAENGVTAAMACWLPDFEYLDYSGIRSKKLPKYSEEAFSKAEPYLNQGGSSY